MAAHRQSVNGRLEPIQPTVPGRHSNTASKIRADAQRRPLHGNQRSFPPGASSRTEAPGILGLSPDVIDGFTHHHSGGDVGLDIQDGPHLPHGGDKGRLLFHRLGRIQTQSNRHRIWWNKEAVFHRNRKAVERSQDLVVFGLIIIEELCSLQRPVKEDLSQAVGLSCKICQHPFVHNGRETLVTFILRD